MTDTLTEDDRQSLAWLRSRPPSIQDLMRVFPPSCRVRATRPLGIPSPGRLGVVTSYFESGELSVMDYMVWAGLEQEPAIRAVCEAAWLEVTDYLGNMTPEWVERVLAGEDIAPAWGEKGAERWITRCRVADGSNVCALDEPLDVYAVVCTTRRMLENPPLPSPSPFGPEGDDLFEPNTAAKIIHVPGDKSWETYQWDVDDPHAPSIQRETWDTRDLPPEHQEPDRIVWCAYDSGEDEFATETFDESGLELALAWLRAHPPGEWVEACAVVEVKANEARRVLKLPARTS